MADNSTLLIPPRDYSDICKLQEPGVLEQFFDEPLPFIVETVTGVLADGLKGWPLVAGRIVQGLLKGRLFQQTAWELKRLREAGRIPADCPLELVNAKPRKLRARDTRIRPDVPLQFWTAPHASAFQAARLPRLLAESTFRKSALRHDNISVVQGTEAVYKASLLLGQELGQLHFRPADMNATYSDVSKKRRRYPGLHRLTFYQNSVDPVQR
jgi:hypothetical protein